MEVKSDDIIKKHMESVKQMISYSGLSPEHRLGREIYKQFELNLKQDYEISELKAEIKKLKKVTTEIISRQKINQ